MCTRMRHRQRCRWLRSDRAHRRTRHRPPHSPTRRNQQSMHRRNYQPGPYSYHHSGMVMTGTHQCLHHSVPHCTQADRHTMCFDPCQHILLRSGRRHLFHSPSSPKSARRSHHIYRQSSQEDTHIRTSRHYLCRCHRFGTVGSDTHRSPDRSHRQRIHIHRRGCQRARSQLRIETNTRRRLLHCSPSTHDRCAYHWCMELPGPLSA